MDKMNFGEQANYIETKNINEINNNEDIINLDFSKLKDDAKSIAEKINSFDRFSFQETITETIKRINDFFKENKEILEKNPEKANAIIEKLGKDINQAILEYMPNIDNMGLEDELDKIVNSENKETNELIQGIKALAKEQSNNHTNIIKDNDPITQAINDQNKRVAIAEKGLSGYFGEFFK